MSRSARVTSIGVLQLLASALQKFRGEAAGALDDLEIEMHRALEWIHHDRKDYWTQELRRGWEGLTQARVQLQQAQTSRRIAGHEPACVDEKRALDRAKRRVETAEEKVRAVQHWERAIDRAVDEFQRSRTQFATWIDSDLLQAVAALNRMSDSLESYVSLAGPADSVMPLAQPEAPGADSGEKPPQTSPDEGAKETRS